MLQTGDQLKINGYTIYRDNLNPKQFYYLPSDKVRIADNGKKIHFVAYIDGEVAEGTEPDFTKDMSRAGGFLSESISLNKF